MYTPAIIEPGGGPQEAGSGERGAAGGRRGKDIIIKDEIIFAIADGQKTR
jgi:hypothetical protein